MAFIMKRKNCSGSNPDSPDHALVAAIEGNDLDAVRAALEAGANVNVKTGGSSALQLALQSRGSEPIVTALIAAGADLSPMKDRLVWAICTGQLSPVRAVIQAGANVNAETPMGNPLIVAVNRGFKDVALSLIDAGADVNAGNQLDSPLLAAIKRGDTEISCALICAGALLSQKDLSGSLPLVEAAYRGDLRVVGALIEAGADVQAEANVYEKFTQNVVHKVTALIAAARQGYGDVVEILLHAGADVRARDGTGLTARDWAIQHKHIAVIDRLEKDGAGRQQVEPGESLLMAAERGDAADVQRSIEEGAPLETRDRRTATEDCTPLLLAALAGHAEVVELLLQAGADHEATDCPLAGKQPGLRHAYLHGGFESVQKSGFKLGRTPLAAAAMAGHDAVVRILIERGAAVNAKDLLGFTPAMLAARTGRHKALQALLEAHADVHICAPDRATACMMAAELGHLEAARTLLTAGARINAKDNDGETALLKAVAGGHLPVVAELLAAGADVLVSSKLHHSILDAARSASRWVTNPDGAQALERISPDDLRALIDTLIRAGASDSAPGGVAKQPRRPKKPRRENPLAKTDFAKASRRSSFQEAVSALGQICGSAPQSLDDSAAGYTFHVTSTTPIDVEQIHGDFLKRGCYVWEPERRGLEEKPACLAVLPTREKYDVIACMNTNGNSSEITTAAVIQWLKELEARQPFILTGIGRDFVAGRFLGPVKKPSELAEKMYEFCPDIVDQGCGTVQELARQLRTKRELFLWWD
jgi:ankyrin repeat protein